MIDARDYGADLSGERDSWAALTEASTEAIKRDRPLYLPSGVYRISKTWTPYDPEGRVYQGFRIIGDGGGERPLTIIDGRQIERGPAIHIRNGRGVKFEELGVFGPSSSDSRYFPSAGIGIDYDGRGSHDIYLERIHVQYAHIGVMHNPSSQVQQGDVWVLNHCTMTEVDVCIASGQSQANCGRVVGGDYSFCKTVYTGTKYGKQQGKAPIFTDVQMGYCDELFDHQQGFGPLIVRGGRAESIKRIGRNGWSNSRFPVTFDGFECSLHPGHDRVIWDGNAPFEWRGGGLSSGGFQLDEFEIRGETVHLENIQIATKEGLKLSNPYGVITKDRVRAITPI